MLGYFMCFVSLVLNPFAAGALATHAQLVASRQVPQGRMAHGHPARCMASTQRELSSSSAAGEERPPPHLVRMKVNFCRCVTDRAERRQRDCHDGGGMLTSRFGDDVQLHKG